MIADFVQYLSRESHHLLFLLLQRGAMTSFKTVTEDDLNADGLSPEDVEGADGGIEADHVDENQNPFAHFLRNLLSGGGRTRQQKIIGEILNTRLFLPLCKKLRSEKNSGFLEKSQVLGKTQAKIPQKLRFLDTFSSNF